MLKTGLRRSVRMPVWSSRASVRRALSCARSRAAAFDCLQLPGVRWITGYAANCNERSQVVACSLPLRFRRNLFDCGAYGTALPFLSQESTAWRRELHATVDFRRLETPLGTLYVTITEDDRGQPFEVFINLGKAGGSAMADAEAIGRLVSLSLRSGVSLEAVRQQLRGISSEKAIGFGQNKVLSMPDAIAQAIELYLAEKQGVQQELLPGALAPSAPAVQPVAATGGAQAAPAIEAYDPGGAFLGTCPECSADLQYMEGCVKCMVCGYSECG